MKIGIPKEIKDQEFRVGITPHGVCALVQAGHQVFVEKDAGKAIGFFDEDYEKQGAIILTTAEEIYEMGMILKVKEPQPSEYPLLKKGQILFCYLHLAPDPRQTEALLKQKVIGIAFETITDDNGRLPLLTPMSEVAGRLSVQEGAHALQMVNGGRGVLLGGIPGVPKGRVVILGGGVVGTEAMRMARGLGAEVIVFEKNMDRLRYLEEHYSGIKTKFSTPAAIEECLEKTDLLIGAVLIPGAKAPKLVTREMLKMMPRGSVFVDVAIDQGGIAETSKATTHTHPIFEVEGVIHYCVANMPAACSRTSTQGLSNAVLPYALKLANRGVKAALLEDQHFLNGLNVCMGSVTNKAVAKDLGYEYLDAEMAAKGIEQ